MTKLLIPVVLSLVLIPVLSCSKYKLVNVEEEEKAKEREALKEELLKELKGAMPKGANSASTAATAPGDPSKAQGGWVKLYDDKGFTDRVLTVRFGRDIGDMHRISSDDGKGGFNDKASAVKYSVPEGWQAVLYENNSYTKRGYALTGNGAIADMGYFSDKCSSLRWEKK